MTHQARWIFLRHARADGAGIFDPCLSVEGRRQVRKVAQLIKKNPRIVVHSPLRRARETATLFMSLAQHFEGQVTCSEILLPETQINFAVDQIKELYAGLDVLFVGHNPTITRLAQSFGAEIEHPLQYCEFAETRAGAVAREFDLVE